MVIISLNILYSYPLSPFLIRTSQARLYHIISQLKIAICEQGYTSTYCMKLYCDGIASQYVYCMIFELIVLACIVLHGAWYRMILDWIEWCSMVLQGIECLYMVLHAEITSNPDWAGNERICSKGRSSCVVQSTVTDPVWWGGEGMGNQRPPPQQFLRMSPRQEPVPPAKVFHW